MGRVRVYAQKQAAGDYAVAEIVKDISPNACQHVHLIDAFDFEQSDRKQIIFTEGAKGGGGKTTLLSSLADFFLAESIPVKLVDADIDNKSRGSLSHLFRGTPKIDIRTDDGLDQFIGLVLDDNAQTVLADLARVGSSKERTPPGKKRTFNGSSR